MARRQTIGLEVQQVNRFYVSLAPLVGRVQELDSIADVGNVVHDAIRSEVAAYKLSAEVQLVNVHPKPYKIARSIC